MDISDSKRHDVVIVRVQGRLDASNAAVLQDRLLGLIGAGARHLVVDCEPLEYISSAGLRVLLVAAKRIRVVGGEIGLAALRGPIKDVFDIAGFSALFPMHRGVDEAVAAVSRA
jgi:anti-sigma B factor antagonist